MNFIKRNILPLLALLFTVPMFWFGFFSFIAYQAQEPSWYYLAAGSFALTVSLLAFKWKKVLFLLIFLVPMCGVALRKDSEYNTSQKRDLCQKLLRDKNCLDYGGSIRCSRKRGEENYIINCNEFKLK
jgi:uncharacterized membrane protein